ncbi:MAG: peptide deformylase [Ktedonobacterales bacterium]|nr:peptide deformylase [Ktedonobacterales bacterium]
MAIRKILTVGGPREKILRTRAKKISRFDAHLQRLVEDLWETMRAAPGVGLAAPQIGESIRVLVAEYEDEHAALVNPEILKAEGEVLGTEGCLSIPGYVGDHVARAASIVVKARDPHGKEIRLRAEGWWARILQHEIDHLDGILYTDRISPADVREVTDDDTAEEGAPPSRMPQSHTMNGHAPAAHTVAIAAETAEVKTTETKTAKTAETADPPARQTTPEHQPAMDTAGGRE